jgi:hypothetical protein
MPAPKPKSQQPIAPKSNDLVLKLDDIQGNSLGGFNKDFTTNRQGSIPSWRRLPTATC